MTLSETHEALARSLADARERGHNVPKPEGGLPAELAYPVQHRVADLLNSPALGWKVGSTSKEAQARLGTDEPGAGAARLLRHHARLVLGRGWNHVKVTLDAEREPQAKVYFGFGVAWFGARRGGGSDAAAATTA